VAPPTGRNLPDEPIPYVEVTFLWGWTALQEKADEKGSTGRGLSERLLSFLGKEALAGTLSFRRR